MAKKMLSMRLLDDGEFWEEIDAETKQKILVKVRKEMAKDSAKKKSSVTLKRKSRTCTTNSKEAATEKPDPKRKHKIYQQKKNLTILH